VIRLGLLRHGATAWNATRRIQGLTDLPLSEAGREQVARWRLPDAWTGCRWVSSPLARCRETAAILARSHGRVEAVAAEARLIEMSHGDWEGRSLAELRAAFGAEMAAMETKGLDYRAPNGESPREVQARLRPWLIEIVAAGEPVLAITHKGVIRALYARAAGWNMTGRPRQRLGDGLHVFRVDRDGAIAIECLNQALELATPAG
jgi:probable phosphoglycerate mutase